MLRYLPRSSSKTGASFPADKEHACGPGGRGSNPGWLNRVQHKLGSAEPLASASPCFSHANETSMSYEQPGLVRPAPYYLQVRTLGRSLICFTKQSKFIILVHVHVSRYIKSPRVIPLANHICHYWRDASSAAWPIPFVVYIQILLAVISGAKIPQQNQGTRQFFPVSSMCDEAIQLARMYYHCRKLSSRYIFIPQSKILPEKLISPHRVVPTSNIISVVIPEEVIPWLLYQYSITTGFSCVNNFFHCRQTYRLSQAELLTKKLEIHWLFRQLVAPQTG
eukprot:scaffold406086_cov51-Prasinocladus_malaysianus.AAC.3